MKWDMPTGFCQIYQLPSEWEPYEAIGLITEEYHVFLSINKWNVVNFGETGEADEFLIEPPSLAVFARGHGESPAKVIFSARETTESVSGLINLLLGSGYPVLSKAYEAVFRKDKVETIKYFPARTRIKMTGVMRSDLLDALKPVAEGDVSGFPEHLKLAYRWYGKGISEEHPVDKFIALYECSLAVATRWHYTEHPEEYEGRDPPPRKIFGDWVRDVMNPINQDEEGKYFEPFDEIISTRNRIFKANQLFASPQDIENAVACATQLLGWSLSS